MKVLIITSSLVQDHEFIYPFYRLKEEGYDVYVYNQSKNIVKGFFGTKIPPQKDDKIIQINEIKVDEFIAVILPGGVKSMELLRLDVPAIQTVKEFNDKGKIVSAICSGTMMLISAKILEGKKATGYYAWKQDIINAGANFVDLPSVVDGKLITSPHYKFNGEWMKSTLEIIKKNI